MTQNLKPEDKEKHKSNNEKLAKSRIKLGLLLMNMVKKINLYLMMVKMRYKSKLEVWDRKKWFLVLSENPSASQSLKGSLYEEKIIVIKSKINLTSKELSVKEAEKIIAEFTSQT